MSIPKWFWVYIKNWACLKKLSMLKPNFEEADGLGNSFHPWIVSAYLCTVTFGFPNSKKNSFRGNYMRKYGSYIFFLTQLTPGKSILAGSGQNTEQFGLKTVWSHDSLNSRFRHYFCSNLYGSAPRGPRGVKKSEFFFHK